MIELLKTKIGRLRIIGFLEGTSLLLLIFIAVPLKHFFGNPALTKMIGPVHGGLFLLYVINAFGVATEYNWKFKNTTWKVILACLIPFGTFYIDNKILRKL
jgi:integral membrane protein